jgi:hypothetical protein
MERRVYVHRPSEPTGDENQFVTVCRKKHTLYILGHGEFLQALPRCDLEYFSGAIISYRCDKGVIMVEFDEIDRVENRRFTVAMLEVSYDSMSCCGAQINDASARHHCYIQSIFGDGYRPTMSSN